MFCRIMPILCAEPEFSSIRPGWGATAETVIWLHVSGPWRFKLYKTERDVRRIALQNTK